MAKMVYTQMLAPWELSQQISTPRAKAGTQKPQGGGKLLVQIPRGVWGMVTDEIDTCIMNQSWGKRQVKLNSNNIFETRYWFDLKV